MNQLSEKVDKTIYKLGREKMQLKTERLSIRPFEVEDKEDIFEIYEDEETCRFLLHEPWTAMFMPC